MVAMTIMRLADVSILVTLALGVDARAAAEPDAIRAAACKALDHHASIMQKGKWGKGGGWCSVYAADLRSRQGSAGQPLPDDVIVIEPAGTPNVGTIFLRAAKVLKDDKYLQIARQAAEAVLLSQSSQGGWNYQVWLSPAGPKPIHVDPGLAEWGDRQPKPQDAGTLDVEVTFAAAEFMYAMWRVTGEEKFHKSWLKAMDFVITCQLPGGGYRLAFPQGGHHAYATFNDGVMLNAVETLLLACERTGDKKYLESVQKCGKFLIGCQGKSGGYPRRALDNGTPAAAHAFEPPGLGPDATRDAILILTQLYDWTGDVQYLAPLEKAAGWLERVKVGKDRWARFYHPDSDRPWYRNVDGKDVPDVGEAKPGYNWQGTWGAKGIVRARAYIGKGPGKPRKLASNPAAGFSLKGGGIGGHFGGAKYPEKVDKIVALQDKQGRWINKGKLNTQQWVLFMDRLLDALESGKPGK